MRDLSPALSGIARRLLGDLAHLGLAVAGPSGTGAAVASAAGGPAMGPDDPIRVASITKIVTGQVALAALGPDAPVDAGAAGTVPLSALLAHTSGLRDDGGYALAPGETVADLARRAITGPRSFAYCNLGYIVAAAAVPGFRARAAAWLRDHSVPGGLNWDGTNAAFRARAVPCLRREGDGFVPQIDAPPVPAPKTPEGASGAGVLSPQGGLRTTLNGCLALARALPRLDARILYDAGPPPPGAPRPLFDAQGAGLMILRRPAFHPRPLVGHFASAYGLAGGVWHDADAGLSLAYLVNGLPAGIDDDDDRLLSVEHAIFAAIAALEG